MAKSIKLSVEEWTSIRKRLKEEYQWKPSIMAIKFVLKRELGFSVRMHTNYEHIDNSFGEWVYLDFYDDAKETLFRLKYL